MRDDRGEASRATVHVNGVAHRFSHAHGVAGGVGFATLRTMRRVLFLFCLTAVVGAGSTVFVAACNGSVATPDAGGSTTPTEDGAVCACATPDCLPNCASLPACKQVCAGGGVLDWVDSCGHTQYAQACVGRCADGGIDDASCEQ